MFGIWSPCYTQLAVYLSFFKKIRRNEDPSKPGQWQEILRYPNMQGVPHRGATRRGGGLFKIKRKNGEYRYHTGIRKPIELLQKLYL